jgi:hypothetical protein
MGGEGSKQWAAAGLQGRWRGVTATGGRPGVVGTWDGCQQQQLQDICEWEGAMRGQCCEQR